MAVDVLDPRRIVSTAVRTTMADYQCDEIKTFKRCGELAWVVLGDGPEERALCITHAAEWLSTHLRMLNAVAEELNR